MRTPVTLHQTNRATSNGHALCHDASGHDLPNPVAGGTAPGIAREPSSIDGCKPTPCGEPSEQSEVILDQNMLDNLRLVERFGKAGFFAQVIGIYRTNSQAQITTMTEAASQGELSKVHSLAHTLKSNSAMVGASRLADLCRELENLTRDGLLPDLGRRISAITLENARVCAALGKELVRSDR
jgi:HPt (histidine-containing phosphotransfer) domain-containing protein